MSDFNPITLYYILHEGMGAWLWLLLALAGALLAGIVASFLKLRRAGRPARRPLLMALAVALVAAVAFTFLVPAWTLAGPGALTGPIDYASAFLFALVPAGLIGSAAFFLATARCVRNARAA